VRDKFWGCASEYANAHSDRLDLEQRFLASAARHVKRAAIRAQLNKAGLC
jgi:hypothetical protein